MISSEDRHPSLARGHRFEKLAYRVVDCSSFSPNYRPEAILEDNPTEQASRWSSAANDQHQYITLRLDQPALICTSSCAIASPTILSSMPFDSHHYVWQVPQEYACDWLTMRVLMG